MTVRSICGVVLAAEDPELLAGFYESVVELDYEFTAPVSGV